jgi:hypothetical protein
MIKLMSEKLYRLHPYLFILVSLLGIYTGARLIASPAQMVRPLLVLWCILFLSSLLIKRWIRDPDWAAALLSILVFGLCFSKTHFTRLGLLVFIFVFVGMISLWLLKKRNYKYNLSALLTWAGLLILFSQIAALLIGFSSIPRSYFRSMNARSNNLAVPLGELPAIKPDIYYIILDGYPRADILRDIYQYDNSSFIQDLEELGFVVPSNSHSNYSRTSISVSTTLDMQYWESIAPDMQGAVYWWLVEPVMDHNRIRATLESIGYQSVSIATDWGITNNPTTDIYLKPSPFILSDYENYLIGSTPLEFLYAPFERIAPVVNNDVHREFIMFNMDELKKLPALPGPKFVFSHIIAPHPPFVFDANGAPLDSKTSFTFDSPGGSLYTPEEYKRAYVEQVEFINKEIRLVIDELLGKSAIPPVIIIQADHGSAIHVDFYDPQGSCMKERFSNFAAYYLPGTEPGVIPQDISPVNIFRIVLNEYFDAQMALLDDRQYFMNGFYLFDTLDVTDRVDDACVIPN